MKARNEDRLIDGSNHSGACAVVPGILLLMLWPTEYHKFISIKFKHVDYIGMILILLGTVLPVVTMHEISVKEFLWDSCPTISLLIVSGIAWGLLIAWQWWISRSQRLRFLQAQLPFRMIAERVIVAALL